MSDQNGTGHVDEHPYEPANQWWWAPCKRCGKPEGDHKETTVHDRDHIPWKVGYVSDDEDD